MSVRVWNTRTRRKEKLEPLEPPRLRLFVCGPTVYDESHVGHAKTYTHFDLIARHLRLRGFDVEYVQNITDVDDKIIERAHRLGITTDALARRQELLHREDMQALGNTGVNRYARAGDFIPQIVSQVERLVARGHAYELPDGHYFDIASFPRYGDLSGRTKLEPQDSVSRIDENPLKRHPGDFVLWKRRKPGEPYWESPLGQGRPGWHIEDTAITETLFGPQYDIHGGAVDLIFPHHEAEIAQMESISGRAPLARYWLHTGLLTLREAKMSKSAGNALTIRRVLVETSPRVLRFFLVRHRYRSAVEFDRGLLRSAASALKRLDDFQARLRDGEEPGAWAREVDDVREGVLGALDDDFDTPAALAILFRFVREQNGRLRAAAGSRALFEELDRVFGFLAAVPAVTGDDVWVTAEVQRRDRLRRERRFAEADEIRDRLRDVQIVVEDSGTSSRWYREPEPQVRA
jgi:cysteinyl-tRNA synthetase